MHAARAPAPRRATRPIDDTTNQKFFPFRDRTPVAAPMWRNLCHPCSDGRLQSSSSDVFLPLPPCRLTAPRVCDVLRAGRASVHFGGAWSVRDCFVDFGSGSRCRCGFDSCEDQTARGGWCSSLRRQAAQKKASFPGLEHPGCRLSACCQTSSSRILASTDAGISCVCYMCLSMYT